MVRCLDDETGQEIKFLPTLSLPPTSPVALPVGCIRLNQSWITFLLSFVAVMENELLWDEETDIAEVEQRAYELYEALLSDVDCESGGSVVPAGIIVIWPSDQPPNGWLLCDGSEISRQDFAALFAVVGTAYGEGDGTTTFNLPDFRRRAPVGAGAGSPTWGVGDRMGEEKHTLTIGEMPPHSHVIRRSAASGTGPRPVQGDGNAVSAMATESVGEGAAHNNVQPSLVVNFVISVGSE